jgi:hypothetical protein
MKGMLLAFVAALLAIIYCPEGPAFDGSWNPGDFEVK